MILFNDKFNTMLENNKISCTSEYVNKVITETLDNYYRFKCKKRKTLKLVFRDMYRYTTELYMSTSNTRELLLQEDFPLTKKIRIQEKFKNILEILDMYSTQYKEKLNNSIDNSINLK